MTKSSLAVALIIFNACAGTFLCEAGSGTPVAGDRHIEQGGDKVTGTKNVQVILTLNKATAGMKDFLDIDAMICNNGPHPVYLFRRIEWGDGGGMTFYIQDKNGKFLQHWNDSLLPPPSRDDPAMFVLLDASRFYGIRSHVRAEDLVSGPGKYTVQVVYHSPFSQNLYDGKLRGLNVLWAEDPKVPSNEVPLEVLP